MRTIVVASGLVAASLLAACGGDSGGGGEPQVDASPDPTNRTYPEGPYGTVDGTTIANLQWNGYFDGDGDKNPFNEEPKLFELAQYYKDPAAKVIWINLGAGWCGPCQAEATEFPAIAAQYEPQGARFVTALAETDVGGVDGTVAYAKIWGERYRLPFATVADPTYALGPYNVHSAFPMNMFVRASDMKILNISISSDLVGLRRLVEYYIANP